MYDIFNDEFGILINHSHISSVITASQASILFIQALTYFCQLATHVTS